MSERFYSTIAGVAVLCLLVGSGVYIDYRGIEVPEPIETIPVRVFKAPTLEGKAVLVYDFKEDVVLFSKEPYAQLPLASLTKLMTAAVTLEKIPEGASIPISAEDLELEGDVGLALGKSYPRDTLLALMLTNSSNDSARALATAAITYADPNTLVVEHDFYESLRKKVAELGLQETYFLNETGLDESISTAGAYGSAYDVAMILGYLSAHAPQILEATTEPTLFFEGKEIKNTNPSVAAMSGLVASKTGFTDLAGGNLAVLLEVAPMHPIAIVVLGSSEEGRFTDVTSLTQSVRAYFAPIE